MQYKQHKRAVKTKKQTNFDLSLRVYNDRKCTPRPSNKVPNRNIKSCQNKMKMFLCLIKSTCREKNKREEGEERKTYAHDKAVNFDVSDFNHV